MQRVSDDRHALLSSAASDLVGEENVGGLALAVSRELLVSLAVGEIQIVEADASDPVATAADVDDASWVILGSRGGDTLEDECRE